VGHGRKISKMNRKRGAAKRTCQDSRGRCLPDAEQQNKRKRFDSKKMELHPVTLSRHGRARGGPCQKEDYSAGERHGTEKNIRENSKSTSRRC